MTHLIKPVIIYIVHYINLFIQTILIYDVYDSIKDDTLLIPLLYLIYILNCIILCFTNNRIIQTYVYITYIFSIYNIYIYITTGYIYVVLWYMVIYNNINIFILKNNELYNINRIIVDQTIETIVLSDDDTTSSSSNEDNQTDAYEIPEIPEINIVIDNNTINNTNNNTTNNTNNNIIDNNTNNNTNNNIIDNNTNNNTIDNLRKKHIRINDECVICLLNLKKKKTIKTKCDHTFHHTCLLKWLRVDNICPICRRGTPLK